MLNYIRIQNVHKVRKQTLDFLLCIEVQQTFSFPFSMLRHHQMPECFYVYNCCFCARAIVLSCYRNWYVAKAVSVNHSRQNKDICFG